MADLDDFFAKKDKNRKKKTTKGISNEDFVQKYENMKCQNDNEQYLKEKKSAEVLNNLEGFIQDNDDEWKDFEDENKDYSGLKIQALTVSDYDDDREKEEEESKKEPVEMPWGKKDESNTQQEEGDDDKCSQEDGDDNEGGDDKEQKDEDKSESSETKKSDLISNIQQLLFKSKKAREEGPLVEGPRIDDAAEFPDLGATPEEIEDAKSFQPVRSGFTVPPPPAPSAPVSSLFGGGNSGIGLSSGGTRGPSSAPPPLPGRGSSGYRSSEQQISTENKYNALRNNY